MISSFHEIPLLKECKLIGYLEIKLELDNISIDLTVLKYFSKSSKMACI